MNWCVLNVLRLHWTTVSQPWTLSASESILETLAAYDTKTALICLTLMSTWKDRFRSALRQICHILKIILNFCQLTSLLLPSLKCGWMISYVIYTQNEITSVYLMNIVNHCLLRQTELIWLQKKNIVIGVISTSQYWHPPFYRYHEGYFGQDQILNVTWSVITTSIVSISSHIV